MRKPPSWFEPADDIILDYVDDRAPTTPGPIEDYTYLDWDYIWVRAEILEAAGLLRSDDSELYSVTDRGRRYLAGDLDLAEEPEPDID